MNSNKQNKIVLITGGTGLLGGAITKELQKKGYRVRYLSRSKQDNEGIESFKWDIDNSFIEEGAFDGVDTLIHLAGANIGELAWNEKNRKRILESRTKSTDLLCEKLGSLDDKPKQIVCASAVGYYMGQGGEKIFVESDEAGSGFPSEVTQKWEKATDQFRALGIPCAQMRIGIVLSTQGGALPQMMFPTRLLAGAPIGSGKQRMSWIHIEDVAGMFVFAMENQLDAVYNVAGSNSTSNADFMSHLRKAMGKINLAPPLPAFVLKIVMGERASLVLEDLAVSPSRIKEAGYKMRFDDLDDCLKDLLVRSI